MLAFRVSGCALGVAILLAALPACGGGGSHGSSALPSTPGKTGAPIGGSSGTATASGPSNVRVSLVIPQAPATSAPASSASAKKTSTQAKRGPAFVSSGTDGVTVTAYLHSDSAHAHPIASAAVDVSPNSSACTATAPRTCSIPISVPLTPAGDGTDLAVALYDAVPVNGAIPSTADMLATGSLAAQTVTANAQNAFTVTVLGIASAVTVALAPGPVPAAGHASTVPLTVTVLDAAGNVILGTFATPIALTTSDTSGATSFKVNGTAGTSVASSTDVVTMVYSGAAITATIGVTGVPPANVTPLTFTPGANPPTASVATLALAQTGTTSGTVTISEAGYTGSYTVAAPTCASKATITPQTAAGGVQSFTIASSTSTGICTVAFSDSFGQSVTVTVTVSGAIAVSPGSLNLVAGNSTPNTLTVTDPSYGGAITQSNTCSGVATVTPASQPGVPASFSVVAGSGTGSCAVTFHDSLSNTSVVNVGVYNQLSASSTSVTLPNNGGTSSPVTISEAGFSGAFSVSNNTCTNIATISPSSGSGPSLPITISRGTSSGTCSINVIDTHGQLVTISITNPALNTLSVTPTTLSMPGNGQNTATVTVSESGYTAGTFSNTNGCGAAISPSGGTQSAGSQVWTFTRGTAAATCIETFTDAYGQTATVNLTVAALNAPSLSLNAAQAVGLNGTATFTESGYTGSWSFAFSPACPAGSVSPASGSTGSGATTTVSTSSATTCTLVVTDAYGQTASATFTSYPAPVAGGTITVPYLSPYSATATATEAGYPGAWSETDTCGGLVTTAAVSNSGATASYTATRVATGSCAITLIDEFGRSVSDTTNIPTPLATVNSVSIDRTNNVIYIGNETNSNTSDAVVAFTTAGAYINQAPLPGECCGTGTYARVLNGTLYVVPFTGPAQPYGLPGLTMGSSFGGTFSGVYAGVARLTNGNIGVADGNANALKFYNSSGTLAQTISTTYPIGLGVDSTGNIYTIGHTTNQVVAYTSGGSLIGVVPLSQTFGTMLDVWVTTDDTLWVSYYSSNTVAQYAISGNLIRSISTPGGPIGLDTDASGNVYVGNGNEVDEYTSTGTHVRTIQ